MIGLLGVIPGMPHLVFLLIAGGAGYAAWRMHAARPAGQARAAATRRAPVAEPNAEASWDDLQPVDTLGLEVGYRLIALVDKAREGDLLARIKGVRKKFAQDVGFLPPPVHIRDNLELKPSMYRLTLRGAVVGEGEAFPGMLLAINPGGATTPLIGTRTTDPAFGLPAVWVEERQRESAQMAGYTVVDCSTVVATHLSHLMQLHAARLLGRVETQQLVDHVTRLAPKLIEDVVPKMVGIAVSAEGAPAAARRGRAHPRHALDHREPGRGGRDDHRSDRAGAPHPHPHGAGDRPADLRAGAASST